MEQNKRRQVAKISVFITSLFVIFLSVTYAFINMTVTGTKRQVITSGNLELQLLEDDNNLTIQNAMPMYDEVGMIQDAFTFRLVNKTSEDTNYIIKLVDITTGEKLDTSIVKYGIVKDGVSTVDLLSAIKNNQIDSGKISGNTTINYGLRFWIDSLVKDNTVINGKSLSYRIDIEAGQNISLARDWPVMKARGTELQWIAGDYVEVPSIADFYSYGYSITDIVFENAINIPATISEDYRWDISEEEGTEQVVAFIEENQVGEDEDVTYKLHIQGNGGVSANSDSSGLFYGFEQLTTIEGSEYFDTSNVIDMSGMFSDCDSLTNVDWSSFDTSSVVNMSHMFDLNDGVLNLEGLNTSNVENMSGMFAYYSGSGSLDLSKLSTSNVTNMSSMFSGYSSGQPLDLSNLDTSNATNMSSMFSDYSSGQPLDLSNLDTSNVTNMSGMFSYYNSSQPLDLSNLNTSNVTDMSSMFSAGKILTNLDLKNFNTSNVTDMSFMFSSCNNLTGLDVSNFDTSSVTNMMDMFYGCSSLTDLDLKNFNTSSVTNMLSMFENCGSVTNLNLTSFDTKNVTNMNSMFGDCSKLISLDLSSFTISSSTTLSRIFSSNQELSYTVVVKNAEIQDLLVKARAGLLYWPTIVVAGA